MEQKKLFKIFFVQFSPPEKYGEKNRRRDREAVGEVPSPARSKGEGWGVLPPIPFAGHSHHHSASSGLGRGEAPPEGGTPPKGDGGLCPPLPHHHEHYITTEQLSLIFQTLWRSVVLLKIVSEKCPRFVPVGRRAEKRGSVLRYERFKKRTREECPFENTNGHSAPKSQNQKMETSRCHEKL